MGDNTWRIHCVVSGMVVRFSLRNWQLKFLTDLLARSWITKFRESLVLLGFIPPWQAVFVVLYYSFTIAFLLLRVFILRSSSVSCWPFKFYTWSSSLLRRGLSVTHSTKHGLASSIAKSIAVTGITSTVSSLSTVAAWRSIPFSFSFQYTQSWSYTYLSGGGWELP